MKRHLCMNIAGGLRQMENMRRTTKSFMTDDNGKVLNVGEARDILYLELQKGHRVVPVGECDNFCYEKGCLGHED